MKNFYLLFIFLIFAGYTTQAQSNVTFIHGLGDSPTVWNPMSDYLDNNFSFNRNDVSYNTDNAIGSTADNITIGDDAIVVAHSLGGLLAREYIRNGNNNINDFQSLITVGTPHYGAPAAENIQNGEISDIFSEWIQELSAGPDGTVNLNLLAQNVLANLGLILNGDQGLLHNQLLLRYGTQVSVDQMIPGSSFLNTLNSNPQNTIPNI